MKPVEGTCHVRHFPHKWVVPHPRSGWAHLDRPAAAARGRYPHDPGCAGIFVVGARHAGQSHGFRLHVLTNSHNSTAFSAEPALVEATERRPAGTETVDRDLPGANPAGDGDRTVHVGAPHRTGKPVLRVVRDPHRVVVVVIAQHRQHRSEYFFLGDGRIRRHLGQDRRFEVEAGIQAGRPTAAGHQLGAVVERLVHVCLNTFQLCGTDQRAHLHLGIGGVADLHGAGQRDQPIDDLVMDGVGKQQPAVQDAGLSGVERTGLEEHPLQASRR